MVRGKFVVVSHKRFSYGEAVEVQLQAVYDGTPENDAYHKYTPNGSITMTVDNPPALEQLTLNKQFYVDFTPAE